MIEVTINLPDFRERGVAGSRLEASATDGYHVEATCTRWSRNRDGSLVLTVEATVKSPPGLVEAMR